MKTTKTIPGLVLLTAMLAVAPAAQATSTTNRVALTITVLRQGAIINNTNAATWVSRVQRTTINNAGMLQLLATATGNSQLTAAGAYIAVEGDVFENHSTLVRSRTGQLLADVSSILQIWAQEPDIYAGNYNERSGAETSTDNFMMGMNFDDGKGNAFSLRGMAKDSYKATPFKNGSQTESSTVTLSAQGSGQLNGQPALFSGSMTMVGKNLSY